MDKNIGIILHEGKSSNEFLRKLIKSPSKLIFYYYKDAGDSTPDDIEHDAQLNQINYKENIKDIISMKIIFLFINSESNLPGNILIELNHSFNGILCIIPENFKNFPAGLKDINLSRCNIMYFPELTLKPFIELLPGKDIEHDEINEIIDFLGGVGYNAVLLKEGSELGVLDRFQIIFINSALQCYENGIDKTNIDGVLKFRFGFSHGILRIMEQYGVNKIYDVYKSFESKIPDVLEDMYRENRSGESESSRSKIFRNETNLIPEDDIYKANPYDLISPVINGASDLLEYIEPEDLDRFFTVEYSSAKGIFSIADSIGINNIVENLHKNYRKYQLPLYIISKKIREMADKNLRGISTGTGFYKYSDEKIDFGPVKYYSVDQYAYILMNRPEALNALNEDMWEGLRLALEKGNSDDNVISIVITGSGRAFSAGDDIAMMSRWNNTVDASLWLDRYANPLIDAIAGSGKPVISIVDGIAFGGGCELNVLFDIVIASDRSIFSVPEGLIGALPPVASSYGISLTGRKLFRYLLTSEWINADKAADLGIVDQVVPGEQLPFMIYEFTEKIRKNAPMSIKNTKKLINHYKENFRTLERLAASYLIINAGSDDFKNGQRAFLNKEKVKWRGK